MNLSFLGTLQCMYFRPTYMSNYLSINNIFYMYVQLMLACKIMCICTDLKKSAADSLEALLCFYYIGQISVPHDSVGFNEEKLNLPGNSRN